MCVDLGIVFNGLRRIAKVLSLTIESERPFFLGHTMFDANRHLSSKKALVLSTSLHSDTIAYCYSFMKYKHRVSSLDLRFNPYVLWKRNNMYRNEHILTHIK